MGTVGTVAAGAEGELGGHTPVRGAAAPGGEPFGAGHDRPAADQFNGQAEVFEHPAGPLHGGQRQAQQLDQAGVGGPAVPAGAVIGEGRH
ncbi:MAG: hypothetical protein JF631_09495, partial [Mycobacterium sp.]|nr:hypothetical protein [Mycobacterium sp.]